VVRYDVVFLVFAIVLSFFSWPSAFCLDLVWHYFPYFIAGCLLARRVTLDDLRPKAASGGLVASIVIFAGLLFLRDILALEGIPAGVVALILAFVGCAGSICLASLTLCNDYSRRLFTTLGHYSTIIYLTHMIPMACVRIAVFDVLRLGATGFIPAGLLAVVSGLGIPMLVQKLVLRPKSLITMLVLGETR
jgi:peptidoglycan/LPS O-acetylase OafA/YrhL